MCMSLHMQLHTFHMDSSMGRSLVLAHCTRCSLPVILWTWTPSILVQTSSVSTVVSFVLSHEASSSWSLVSPLGDLASWQHVSMWSGLCRFASTNGEKYGRRRRAGCCQGAQGTLVVFVERVAAATHLGSLAACTWNDWTRCRLVRHIVSQMIILHLLESVRTVLWEVGDSMSLERDLIGPVIQSGMLTCCLDTVEILALFCSKVSKARTSRRRNRKSKRLRRTCQSHSVSVQCRLNALPTLQSPRVSLSKGEWSASKNVCRLNQGGVSRAFPLPMSSQKKLPQLAQL